MYNIVRYNMPPYPKQKKKNWNLEFNSILCGIVTYACVSPFVAVSVSAYMLHNWTRLTTLVGEQNGKFIPNAIGVR